MPSRKSSLSFWWYFTNFWTLIVFWVVVCDFIADNAFNQYLGAFLAVYIAILAIYASNKEFERWRHLHVSRHPGEVYVIVWTILILGIFVLDTVMEKAYEMPDSIISSYIAILTVLAITMKSRRIYERKLRK